MKPETLDAILTERFEACVDSTQRSAHNKGALARFLGLSEGHLSRLCHGRVRLTKKFAKQFALKFEPNNPLLRKGLEELLLSNAEVAYSKPRPTENISLTSMIKIINELSCPGALLIAIHTHPFTGADIDGIDKILGKAVARGLSLAMFQPFGTIEDIMDLEKTTPPNTFLAPAGIRSHWCTVAENVREYWSSIKRAAEKERDNAKPDDGPGSVVLYEKASPTTNLIFGSNETMFLARHKDEDNVWNDQVFVLAAGIKRHYFIEISPSAIPPSVVRHQFHPITTDWVQQRSDTVSPKLPTSADALNLLYKKFWGSEQANNIDKTPPWRIFGSWPQRA